MEIFGKMHEYSFENKWKQIGKRWVRYEGIQSGFQTPELNETIE